MFYQAVLELFVHFNMFLQRDDPLIPVLHTEVNAFLKKLFTRLVKVAVIQVVKDDIVSTDYKLQTMLTRFFITRTRRHMISILFLPQSLEVSMSTLLRSLSNSSGSLVKSILQHL